MRGIQKSGRGRNDRHFRLDFAAFPPFRLAPRDRRKVTGVVEPSLDSSKGQSGIPDHSYLSRCVVAVEAKTAPTS